MLEFKVNYYQQSWQLRLGRFRVVTSSDPGAQHLSVLRTANCSSLQAFAANAGSDQSPLTVLLQSVFPPPCPGAARRLGAAKVK